MSYKIITVLLLILIIQAGCSNTNNKNSISETQAGKSNEKEKITLNKNIYDLSVKTMEGEEKRLSDYEGKVLLIVNVASKCGYTIQYEGLENLYEKYKDREFEILAFPCNDFGGQEPGTNDEIRTFCESKYNVTFTLFDKVRITGDGKSSLYERLTANSEPAGDVDWNFEKFLISRKGDIVYRFKSKVKPESEVLTTALENELNK